jgi:hypothetical protein
MLFLNAKALLNNNNAIFLQVCQRYLFLKRTKVKFSAISECTSISTRDERYLSIKENPDFSNKIEADLSNFLSCITNDAVLENEPFGLSEN